MPVQGPSMHVAVLGAGYAGLAVARRLERELPQGVDLTVVDTRDYHLVQHELHRVIRRPSLAADIQIPLTSALDWAEVHQATVTTVDPEANIVEVNDGRLEYDLAAVCLGAETDFQDLPGVREQATPLQTLAHAERIRADFLDIPHAGRVIVGGAGLSGVQVAGELAALANETDRDVELLLLERFPEVTPDFPDHFQTAVREELEARGVTVRTDAPVARADDDVVELASGEQVAYDQFIWTGGIRGPGALGNDRPIVRNDLRLGDGTFVVGDAARVVDADGEAVPASAQAAVREAKIAAANIATLARHNIEGSPEPRLERFRFRTVGWAVSVGDGAVAQIGPTVVRGAAARAAKASIGASYLGGMGAVHEAADLVREELGWPD